LCDVLTPFTRRGATVREARSNQWPHGAKLQLLNRFLLDFCDFWFALS
jgi:hypothetical protein